MTGIERTYLSKMENGKVGLPLAETRERIHAALGTTDADVTAFGIDVRRDYETRNQEIERAITRGKQILESFPAYAVDPSPEANPFQHDDPRWQYVEILKRFDLNDEYDAFVLVAVAQVLRLIDGDRALLADPLAGMKVPKS